MSNQYIALPADGAGKKVQTFENSIGGNTVQATAVSIVTSAGVSCDPPAGTGVAVCGNVSSGASDSGSPVKVAGVYNSTAPTLTNGQRGDLQVDANGNLKTSTQLVDSTKATYSAAVTFAPAASSTDIFEFLGSSSKVVKVVRLRVSLTNSSLALVNVFLYKRSTAASGGTPTNPTQVPHDSSDSAGTVTIKAYTANPSSLGTLVGAVRTTQINAFTSAITAQTIEWVFGESSSKALTLRSAAQSLCLNIGGSTVTAAQVEIEWTEE